MIASALLVVLLAVLAVFQLALASAAPWGRFAWGGQHDVLPVRFRVGSVVSVAVYTAIAAMMLDRAGSIDIVPTSVSRPVAWVVFAYFVLGVGMNGVSRSPHERRVMVPVTLVLAVLSLLVTAG